MRTTFVKTLEEIAKNDPSIMVLTADLGTFFRSFQEKFPKQFIDCGVAEQNMIGVAAGLALSGRNVYCYSIIPFLTMRALESIRVDVCYHNLNVKLLGAGGGLIRGLEGITHCATEDVAIMRSLSNMTIVAPGDLLEVEAFAKESVNFQGPLYIRFGRNNPFQIHQSLPDFKIGKGIILERGQGTALIVAGSLLFEAKKTVEKLTEKGIKATLISMPTIKPIDRSLLEDLIKSHQAIFTLEDHSKIGGLGSAVLDILNSLNFKGLFKKIALPDKYSQYIGKENYLYKCYGLDSESILEYILKEIKNENTFPKNF